MATMTFSDIDTLLDYFVGSVEEQRGERETLATSGWESVIAQAYVDAHDTENTAIAARAMAVLDAYWSESTNPPRVVYPEDVLYIEPLREWEAWAACQPSGAGGCNYDGSEELRCAYYEYLAGQVFS